MTSTNWGGFHMLLVLLAIFVALIAPLAASAGVLADVYVKKVAGAVYQTGVYALDVKVEPKAVTVQKCLDGIRIIMIRGDRGAEPVALPALEQRVMKQYQWAVTVTSVSPTNCPDGDGNVIRFEHKGRAGDRAFYDAVEVALRGWLHTGAKVVRSK